MDTCKIEDQEIIICMTFLAISTDLDPDAKTKIHKLNFAKAVLSKNRFIQTWIKEVKLKGMEKI